jgi:hypothetical protein
MNLKQLKEKHFTKLSQDMYAYSNTWTTWTVEGEAKITIFLVEDNTALVEYTTMNDATGRENNKWLIRKVKEGKIQFNSKMYPITY